MFASGDHASGGLGRGFGSYGCRYGRGGVGSRTVSCKKDCSGRVCCCEWVCGAGKAVELR